MRNKVILKFKCVLCAFFFTSLILLAGCNRIPEPDTSADQNRTDAEMDSISFGQKWISLDASLYQDREYTLCGNLDKLEADAPAHGKWSLLTILSSYTELLSFTEEMNNLWGDEASELYLKESDVFKCTLPERYTEEYWQHHCLILYRICDNVGVQYNTREIWYNLDKGIYKIVVDYKPGESEIQQHKICVIEVPKEVSQSGEGSSNINLIVRRVF